MMQALPVMVVDVPLLRWNMDTILRRCREWNISPVAVTKGCLADPVLIETLWKQGFRSFADANFKSLLSLRKRYGMTAQLQLIRLPMKRELKEIVETGIIPHLSHVEVLNEINELAGKKGKKAQVFLTVEGGDGREGFLPDELIDVAKFRNNWAHIKIIGMSLSLACLSGVLPDREVLYHLLTWRDELSRRMEEPSLLLSVGGSTFLPLWEQGHGIEGIHQIRLGEAWLLGTDISRKKCFSWLKQGAFTLQAEIVELRRKKVNDKEEKGFNAFGKVVESSSGSYRKRALLAVGAQDIDETQLYLQEENAKIIGVTSNYLVLDVEDCAHNYHPGEVMEFEAGYGTVMRAYLSPFMNRVYHY